MPLHGLSILVVDDDYDAREITRRMLGFLGARVETARSGQEGLSKLEKAWPNLDLALVDIMMPGIDGFEFAKRVRRMRKCARACLVALTALSSHESYMATWAAGFDGHVEKPVTFEKLRAIAER